MTFSPAPTTPCMFSFGGPKGREAAATVGGVRALAVIDTPEGLAASRKVFPYGYFVEVKPGPVFVGVEKPMKAYALDYLLNQHQDQGRRGLQNARHHGEEQSRP